MRDQDIAAIHPHRAPGIAQEIFEQRRLKTIARDTQMLELMCLDQPPGTVVLENHPVTTHHITSIAFFRRIELVADQFKNDVVTRQGENEHHHPARALGRDEAIARCLEVPDEIAIKFGLGMSIVTDRVVEIGRPFVWHQLAQPMDQLKGRGRVDPEVGAGVRKENCQIAFSDQNRVEHQSALPRVAET